jgi:uncharacterized damage-inducible protein DinB
MKTLLESFDYDLWANQLWIEPAEAASLNPIFDHLIFSQEIWLTRCQGKPFEKSAEDYKIRMPIANAGWKELLSSDSENRVIEYKNFFGDPAQATLVNIALHVLNHGTYHRGEMRARCELQGLPFPETDRIRFLQL